MSDNEQESFLGVDVIGSVLKSGLPKEKAQEVVLKLNFYADTIEQLGAGRIELFLLPLTGALPVIRQRQIMADIMKIPGDLRKGAEFIKAKTGK